MAQQTNKSAQIYVKFDYIESILINFFTYMRQTCI